MLASFAFPTAILFGAGSISEVPQRLAALGVSKPMIVTDARLLQTPAFASTHKALGHHKVFSGVQSNPTAANVAKIMRLCIQQPDWNLSQAPPERPALAA